MLDIKYVRENPDELKKVIEDRQMVGKANVDTVLELDDSYRALLFKVETHRSLRNQLSKDISKVNTAERNKLIKEAAKVKEELLKMEEELKELQANLELELKKLPNTVAEDVPFGVDENENKVIRTWGKLSEFDFEPKDHVDLGEALDLIDIESSARISGSRFNYLMNEAVMLQFGIIQMTFEILTNEDIIGELAEKVGNPFTKPFIPVLPPVFIKSDIAQKMDRFDPIEDRYFFEKDDALLVGSAEHTLGPLYLDALLEEDQLPIRLVGYSTAFRREAGSYGKDTRGILRRHQFDKIEMETFTMPEHGLAEQNLIVAIQEYLVQQLKIPYQVMAICTGDMGKPDFRQIDIECWMPGENKYRETHTSDYMTDFQSRRLNTRYKAKNGENYFVHMNDATAFAIGRILIAILENNQQKDGSVVIPEVLHKYVGKEVIGNK
ncbi:MAG: serine--tRNA ligase [Patescibacteria group bacterium]